MKKRSLSEVVGDYNMAATLRANAPGNIRAGYNIKSAPSTDQSAQDNEDIENQDNSMLQKIAVVLVTKNNNILAVSRNKDLADMNMPGGHVESGEPVKDAAIRELWEETGIKANKLFPILTSVYDGNLVTAYRAISFSGKLRPSAEGMPMWVNKSVLMKSSFGDFFRSVLNSLRGDKITK